MVSSIERARGKTIVFDIETFSADLRFSMQPEQFVRLSGWKVWGEDEVHLTADLEEIRAVLRAAKGVVGCNIIAFDLPAVFGHKSNEPLEMADANKVYDTFVHAPLVHPAPFQYTNRHGKSALAKTPEQMKRWFGLDEQAYQLGVAGKTDDLGKLALEFGDRSLKPKARQNDGYGKIPTDDPRYRGYLEGDVRASEAVAKALLKLGPRDDYTRRAMRIAARAAVITSNGLRVDRERAQARVDALAERKAHWLDVLQRDYGLPVEGASPWATNDGKAAILKALAEFGITEASRPDWQKTDSGALSLGGGVLKEITAGTEAEELGMALAELKGQRSLAQLALDSCHPDGFVHPEISMLQRSGRWSTTNPGLTVWTKSEEKAYYVPDSEDDVLLEIDYSNADARVVAWLSGDTAYAERFEPGADGHLINAWAAWGKNVVGTDKSNPATAKYRQMAKPLGHGWSYGGQYKTLSRVSGVPLEDAKKFCVGMARAFSRIIRWQDHVRKKARAGYVVNPWGRKMYVEKGREFTQAPALFGQSGTTEIICDALLDMSYEALRRVKANVHDALLFSVPRAEFEEWKAYYVGVMETVKPALPGGQEMSFPVGAGPAGDDWWLASHE